jgi:hypothetical protein
MFLAGEFRRYVYIRGKMKDHFDVGSLIVIAVTFVLFVAALFTKGLTHDLLLEAGVFLVSVKLIIMAYKSSVTTKALLEELREIRKDLKKKTRGSHLKY